MPTDLDIDHVKPLRGAMPHYTRHIVIRTGQNDWESRIEDGPVSNLARELKGLIGPKGEYYNPKANFLITNSSFDSWSRHRGRSVSIYPDGYTVFDVDESSDNLERFVRQFLILPSTDAKNIESDGPLFQIRQPDDEPTVLICGHNSRDRRCGVLGPLLRNEFLAWIYRQRILYSQRTLYNQNLVGRNPETGSPKNGGLPTDSAAHGDSYLDWTRMNCSMKVGLISHIGGHAWAGNVIIYLPPKHRLADGKLSPLAGKGVWYGRVEPRHVEGIIEETIRNGRVIKELLRGIHGEVDIT